LQPEPAAFEHEPGPGAIPPTSRISIPISSASMMTCTAHDERAASAAQYSPGRAAVPDDDGRPTMGRQCRMGRTKQRRSGGEADPRRRFGMADG